jgi:hypothetical protein
MLSALARLGRIRRAQTKTTVLLAPKAGIGWRAIRRAVVANMHPRIGNVAYVNLRSRRAFEWGSASNHHWREMT